MTIYLVIPLTIAVIGGLYLAFRYLTHREWLDRRRETYRFDFILSGATTHAEFTRMKAVANMLDDISEHLIKYTYVVMTRDMANTVPTVDLPDNVIDLEAHRVFDESPDEEIARMRAEHAAFLERTAERERPMSLYQTAEALASKHLAFKWSLYAQLDKSVPHIVELHQLVQDMTKAGQFAPEDVVALHTAAESLKELLDAKRRSA